MMESKKDPGLDLRRRAPLFFNVGLVISLLLVITAFEWKFYETVPLVDFSKTMYFVDDVLVPITEQKVIPPVPEVVNIVEVIDDVPLIDEPPILVDIDYQEDKILEAYEFEKPAEEPVETTFTIVEQMPTFQGEGQAAFLRYVMERINYPHHARKIQLQGRVFASFIIDKDGTLTEITIVRGIGGGCDAEVERVLAEAPRWEPGKQRGRPVKVRMILPVTFRLE